MYNDELYHHGIFGQKWGKRNGPPYPLAPEKHSIREKRSGWRKSLNNKKEDKVTVLTFDHPDSKYFDSRKFGTNDLNNLTSRFNSEKAFNDALAAKLRSENMMDQEAFRSMSRKQRQELYRKITEMEADNAYARAYNESIQNQINIIQSKQRLSDLTKNPPTKMQRAGKAVGKMLMDIGSSSVRNIGGQVATYYLGTAVNKIAGANIVDPKKSGGGGGNGR